MRLPFMPNGGSSPFGVTASQLVERQAAEQQRARIERIAQAWQAYNGTGPRPFVRLDPAHPDDNTCVNWHQIAVDTGVSFLLGDGLEIEVDSDTDAGVAVPDATREAAQSYLDQCWDANGEDILLHDIAVNGAVSGDCFVKLKYVPGQPWPRLINLDPATVMALWDVDDIDAVAEYRIEWQGVDPRDGKARQRRQIIRPESANAWSITDQVRVGDSGTWAELNSERWPYPWPPIVHWKNMPSPNEFYGRPDVTESLKHLQDRANYNLSNRARIDRLHAHPKTWGKGFAATELDMGPEALIVLPAADASLQNLEMQTDLGASRELYGDIEEAYYQLAQVPPIATGKVDNVGQLSGLALQILYGPLVRKTETKRMLYGEGLELLCRRVLEYGGFAGIEVDVHWPNILPADQAADAQAGQTLVDLGVSRATVLTRLGFDADEEAARRADEDAARAETEGAMGEAMLTAFERGQTAQARRMQGGTVVETPEE